MNALAKLIAAIAALIVSLTLAWIAKDGVTVRHEGHIGVASKLELDPIQLEHSKVEIELSGGSTANPGLLWNMTPSR